LVKLDHQVKTDLTEKMAHLEPMVLQAHQDHLELMGLTAPLAHQDPLELTAPTALLGHLDHQEQME
jgi:hypothetical protein